MPVCPHKPRVWLIIAAIAAVLAGFGVGCQSSGEVTIPTAPTWIQADDARELTPAEVSAEIRRLRPSARVTAVNTVTIRAYNPTGTPIDPASATYAVRKM